MKKGGGGWQEREGNIFVSEITFDWDTGTRAGEWQMPIAAAADACRCRVSCLLLPGRRDRGDLVNGTHTHPSLPATAADQGARLTLPG